MKHQNNLLHAIDALNDLAAETNFVAAAVGALGQSESSGLALIIQRWSDTLSTLADDIEVDVAFEHGVSEAPDNSRTEHARTAAHGSAESWDAADDAAVAAIQEAEANA